MQAVLFFCGCGRPRTQESRPRPVETAVAIEKDMPVYIESFGNLKTPYDVDIKSQVTGQIQEVHFKEGQETKKSDLLFIIDPSIYKAQVDKAQAALAQDLADLKLKEDTLRRNKKLLEKQLISLQDFDKYQTDVASARAKAKLDKAALELAIINLDYCFIRSPIDGLTGKRQVDPGNIVSANTGPVLVNIKAIDSFYIDFTIPEMELGRLRKAMGEGKLKVGILLEGAPDKPYSGELQFLDNAVDNTTGTVALRAIISNKDRSLWAGQFVRVRLILSIDKNAVIVPYQAVQLGQKGNYLFAVTPDNKADLRIVNVGSREKDYIVIEDGIKAGDRVVTAGQMGLSPGASIIDVTQH